VMQMKVKFNLKAADGAPVSQEIFNTIHKLSANGPKAELILKRAEKDVVGAQVVSIRGEVKNPGRFAWEEGATAADLLRAAGGRGPLAAIYGRVIRDGKMIQRFRIREILTTPGVAILESDDEVVIEMSVY